MRTECALQKYVFHKNKITQQYCTASQQAPVPLAEVGYRLERKSQRMKGQ